MSALDSSASLSGLTVVFRRERHHEVSLFVLHVMVYLVAWIHHRLTFSPLFLCFRWTSPWLASCSPSIPATAQLTGVTVARWASARALLQLPRWPCLSPAAVRRLYRACMASSGALWPPAGAARRGWRTWAGGSRGLQVSGSCLAQPSLCFPGWRPLQEQQQVPKAMDVTICNSQGWRQHNYETAIGS